MKGFQDSLVQTVAELSLPPLDEKFAHRVLAQARAELAPAEPRPSLMFHFGRAVNVALVPALLMSAMLCFTAETAELVTEVYGTGDGPLLPKSAPLR